MKTKSKNQDSQTLTPVDVTAVIEELLTRTSFHKCEMFREPGNPPNGRHHRISVVHMTERRSPKS